MADRSIMVRLRAEVGEFKRAMGEAAKSTEQVGTSGEQATRKMDGAFSRLAQHARDNQQAWNTAGTALVTFGGAITAVGVAALKTGIQYNTLQQTSRAALTTLLGSAEAANAQMDKLDDFARTSPFAKQVFIEAQQQMLGFGIEAQRVIPYLDSIQNAVAATGGSNEDIAELSYIFAKISSSSKITAVDLMQFGKRGVDAAELIGSQMGMTGGEIRDAITDGSLDAGTALDALAAGMQERFGGAADNVKNTFAGALDRVKAAFRDLSSELAGGLVNPDGGGKLVDWLNSVADAMRNFQALPGPVKATAAALTGLVGVGSLAAGTALLLIPRYVMLADAFGEFGRVGKGIQGMMMALPGQLARLAVRAGAAALAFVALGEAGKKAQEAIYGTAAGTNELARALRTGDFDVPFEHLTGGYDSLGESLRALTGSGVLDKLDRGLSMVNQALGGHLPDDVQGAADAFDSMGQALASLAQGGNAEEAARQFDMLAAEAARYGVSTEQLLDLMPAYRDALVGLEDGAQGAAGAQLELADGTSAAQEALEEWQKSVASAGQSFGGIIDVYQSVIDKNRELAEGTAAATGDAEASWEDFYDGTSVSMSAWIAEMEEHARALQNWRDNYLTAVDQIRTEVPDAGREAHIEFVNEMLAAGEGGAAALQEFVDATPEQRDQLVAEWQAGRDALDDIMDTPLTVEALADMDEADATIRNWQATMLEQVVDIPISADPRIADVQLTAWRVGQALLGMDVPVDAETSDAEGTVELWRNNEHGTLLDVPVDADPLYATESLLAWRNDQSNTTSDTNIDADTSPAEGTMGKLVGDIERTTAVTNLDADDDPAQGVLTGFTGSAARARPIVPLGANDKGARATTNAFTNWANGRSPSVKVDAGTSGARKSVSSLTSWVRGRSASISVGASTSKAAAAVNSIVGSINSRSATIKVGTKQVGKKLATGGPVHGPGTGTSDSVPAMLSNGEHVWTAREVAAAGGHGAIMALRAAALGSGVRAYANGGAVSPTYVTTPAPVVHVAAPTPAERRGGATFHVDQIVAADPQAAAQAFTREVRYQTMGA